MRCLKRWALEVGKASGEETEQAREHVIVGISCCCEILSLLENLFLG